jgi:exosortase/archaeosortase family protein
VLRFVLVLAGLTIAFNAFFYLVISKSALFESYLGVNAQVSAAILRLFGEDASAGQTVIRSPSLPLEIKRGCDAIQASAFFVFIVLASPVGIPLRRRLPAVLLGTLALLFLNIARIVSLFYAAHYSQRLFNVLHVEVWQPVFIFLPLCFWFVWLRRAMRGTGNRSDVPG